MTGSYPKHNLERRYTILCTPQCLNGYYYHLISFCLYSYTTVASAILFLLVVVEITSYDYFDSVHRKGPPNPLVFMLDSQSSLSTYS
jgi:hypothetical protein